MRTISDEADKKVNTGPSRRSVRFNDACCTMTARLPKADYIWVRGAVDARIKLLGSDGESPLDERAGDALMTLLGDALRPAGKPTTPASQELRDKRDSRDGRPIGSAGQATGRRRSYRTRDPPRRGGLRRRAGRARACRAWSVPRSSVVWPVTPRSSSLSTMRPGTPCTRAGPSASRPRHSVESSGVATDTVASRDAPTTGSPGCTTSCPGSPMGAPTSTILRFSVSITTTRCTRSAGVSRVTRTSSSPSSAPVDGA